MTGRLHIIISVRGGAGAKRRCADLLSAPDRIRLTGLMLGDMLGAIAKAESVSTVRVVTLSPELIPIIERAGCRAVAQEPPTGLNEAFSQGMAAVRAEHGDVHIGMLPADLPWLEAAELNAAAAKLDDHDLVVAPSRDGGTGALLTRAGVELAPCFGTASCSRHLEAARAAGLSSFIFEARGFHRDIDCPADILELSHGPTTLLSARFLRERMDVQS